MNRTADQCGVLRPMSPGGGCCVDPSVRREPGRPPRAAARCGRSGAALTTYAAGFGSGSDAGLPNVSPCRTSVAGMQSRTEKRQYSGPALAAGGRHGLPRGRRSEGQAHRGAGRRAGRSPGQGGLPRQAQTRPHGPSVTTTIEDRLGTGVASEWLIWAPFMTVAPDRPRAPSRHRSAAVGLEVNLAARTRRAVSPVTVRGPAPEPGFVLRGHSAGHPGCRMTGWSL
jgi:hypothetical protein